MPSNTLSHPRSGFSHWPALLLPAVLALAACGGSDDAPLMLSEVSANAAADDSAWVEVYNPNEHPINLADYQLRTGTTDGSAAGDPAQPKVFALPEATVPPRGVLVVAAAVKITSWSSNNAQIVYVRDGATSPYWGSSGFVELLSGNESVDFVRFGSSTAAPLSPDAWSGPNLPALPEGDAAYGKSIVRPMPKGSAPALDRAAKAWAQVNFATPAGPNDIAAGVVDSDGDGIPDSAKQPGGSYGGLDLYAMGARAGQRDIFLQIDHMTDPDDGRSEPWLQPRKEALQKVVDAFANSSTSGKPYALHIDVGPLYSANFSPRDFNLGGGREVAFHPCIGVPSRLFGQWGPQQENCATLQEYKSAGFDQRRRLVFHYAIFANSQHPDGSPSSSGIAELYGNDFVVTLGRLSTDGGTTNTNIDEPHEYQRLVNVQASTLMHEFGHNLGLGHGGDDLFTNYKPNYLSIMNYLYQMEGMGASFTDTRANDRYLHETQDASSAQQVAVCERPGGNPPGVITMSNSPCTAEFKIDFSNGTSLPLNPAEVDEGLNMGRGSDPGAYADWNHNGYQDLQPYALCLNPANYRTPSDCPTSRLLTDFNDWDNLVLPFSRYYNGANNGAPAQTLNKKSSQSRDTPVRRHPRQIIVETLTLADHPAAPGYERR